MKTGKTGTEQILAERQRQITKEGWSADHDDRHDKQELKRAAESYRLSAQRWLEGFKSIRPPDGWPWAKKWWKPKNALRDLIRAGALYLAEMDREKRHGAPEGNFKCLGNDVESCARRIDDITRSD
jgi:hypothetical protein